MEPIPLKKQGISLIILLLSFVFSKAAEASEFSFEFDDNLEASEFEQLARNLVTPLRFQFVPLADKPLSFGASYRQTQVEQLNQDLIQSKSRQTAPKSADSLAFIAASLPLGLTFAKLAYNGFHYWGVGLRSIIPAGAITLVLRGGYTYLVGNDYFCAPSTSGEFLAHFKTPFIKPYVGLGVSQHKASYTPASTLQDHEYYWKDFYFMGGLRLSLSGPLSLGAELNNSNENSTLSFFAMLSL